MNITMMMLRAVPNTRSSSQSVVFRRPGVRPAAGHLHRTVDYEPIHIIVKIERIERLHQKG